MKNIVLKTLELKNFKSFRHAKFDDFNEKKNFIYGKNGAGKSTIEDASCWLWTGKDSKDRKDYEIKSLDENNQTEKQINVEVHAVYLINNFEEISLSRIYKERWEEVKGTGAKVFKGHKTELIFNQVPVSLKEFNAKVDEIFKSETLFKLITNPS
ncbi:MAG TPA: hypothetical protein DCR77_06260, partial [Flavobacteriaceae bacterium]|nr:hypothetical protein [Flavobacteriaceae bacterium]